MRPESARSWASPRRSARWRWAHAYAKKLAAAGNAITYAHYPDLPHGIIQMTAHSKACLAATEEIGRLLRERLAAAMTRNDGNTATH